MKTLKLLLLAILPFYFISCSDDDVPEAENEEEIITDITLTFTGGGETITATAQDPDGEGPEDIEVTSSINLSANTEYTLAIELENSIEGESITEEVEEEGDEHMFFFAFTEGLFSDPAGDGNTDNRGDAVNYVDTDADGQPVGLSTTWTTADAGNGSFRVILKHQPGVKTATSTSSDGETDVDLTWTISVQ